MRAAIAAKTLSNAAKDPETVEFKSVIGHADGTICFDYRAKNSFNAMLKGSAVLLPKGNMLVEERDGNAFVREWNKHCTARGTQIVDVVNLLLGKHV